MTRFMKLFLSLAAVSCHCGLAQELQVSYTTELQSDFKQGSNWVNLLRLDFTHSLGKHTTLQAATISTARTRAESLADDFQTFSNIEEENHPLALATLGIQQLFGHSSLFFGIRNLNEDYFTSPATSLFTNSSCGIFPTLSADYQIANYPVASVGLHYELQFTRWSLQASVYNGKGYYRFAGKENVFRFCPQQDGILSVTSLNYQHHDSNYHVGFALHSGMYMDYEEGTPEKTEKERRKVMKKFISILPAVILAALVMTGMDAEAAGTFNTIENGVFIGDIDVSGMTTLEAEDAVNSYVDGLKEKEITLNALNGNTVTVTAEELGIEWDNKEVVDEAGELGKAGNIVQRYKALKDLEHQNEIFPLSISIDEAAVRSDIEEKCLQ